MLYIARLADEQCSVLLQQAGGSDRPASSSAHATPSPTEPSMTATSGPVESSSSASPRLSQMLFAAAPSSSVSAAAASPSSSSEAFSMGLYFIPADSIMDEVEDEAPEPSAPFGSGASVSAQPTATASSIGHSASALTGEPTAAIFAVSKSSIPVTASASSPPSCTTTVTCAAGGL